MRKAGFYYEIASMPKFIGGAGCRFFTGGELASLSARSVFVVTDGENGSEKIKDEVTASLRSSKLKAGALYVWNEGADTVSSAYEMREGFRVNNCDSVAVCGGNDAVNAAKALVLLLKTQARSFEEISAVGVAKAKANIPFAIVPRDAAAGDCIAPGVYPSGEFGGIISSLAVPDVCVSDPEAVSEDPKRIAEGAADIIAQNLESLVSLKAVKLTKSMNLFALREVRDALNSAVNDASDKNAVWKIQQAGILGGITYANAGAGVARAAVNAIAGVSGRSRRGVSGIALRSSLEYNAEVVSADYARAVYYLIGDERYAATEREERCSGLISAAADTVERLFGEYGIPRSLEETGLSEEDIPALCGRFVKDLALLTNPCAVKAEDAEQLFRRMLRYGG